MNLQIPDTPFSIPPHVYIAMIEDVLAERIGRKISINRIFLRRNLTININGGEQIQDALCYYELNPYGKAEKLQIASIDPECIELWECIQTLKKILK